MPENETNRSGVMPVASENTAAQTDSTPYIPKTPFGKKLAEIRERAIKNGLRLLSQEELEQEIAEGKGIRK